MMDYPEKELYDAQNSAFEGKTLRNFMISLGTESFDVDRYINSEMGRITLENCKNCLLYESPMDPRVLDYWKHYGKGLIKQAHENSDGFPRWISYTPTSMTQPGSTERRYPLIIMIHNELPDTRQVGFQAEGWGFVQLAAREEIIVVTPDRFDDATILGLYERVIQHYPVDLSRVYMTGFSLSGFITSRFAIQHPELLAGISYNAQFYPFFWDFPTDKMVEHAAQYRMPVIKTVGTVDWGKPIPMNRGLYCINANGTDHIRSAQQEVDAANLWLRINHCRTVTLKEARAMEHAPDDRIYERVFGFPVSRGCVGKADGETAYYGDIFNEKGQALVRMIAVENQPHWPIDSAACATWDFWRCFSRDVQTKELIVHQQPKLPAESEA